MKQTGIHFRGLKDEAKASVASWASEDVERTPWVVVLNAAIDAVAGTDVMVNGLLSGTPGTDANGSLSLSFRTIPPA